MALFQDLSAAYALGKSLPDLPDEGTARRPEAVAEPLHAQLPLTRLLQSFPHNTAEAGFSLQCSIFLGRDHPTWQRLRVTPSKPTPAAKNVDQREGVDATRLAISPGNATYDSSANARLFNACRMASSTIRKL